MSAADEPSEPTLPAGITIVSRGPAPDPSIADERGILRRRRPVSIGGLLARQDAFGVSGRISGAGGDPDASDQRVTPESEGVS
ncbi:hypothetical protein ACO03V_01585 [Microbacterium sp. HMH0099]